MGKVAKLTDCDRQIHSSGRFPYFRLKAGYAALTNLLGIRGSFLLLLLTVVLHI